jgi:hypothetical membrane protein
MTNTLRHLGTVALCGMLAFATICLAAQWLRPDLDWTRVPMSFYLIGPYGGLVRGAYFLMAASLVLIGSGWYLALSRRSRSAAPLLLFSIGAVSLCVTALQRTNTAGLPPTFEGYVHGVASQTAFLCTVTAMILQAMRLRRDPAWRHWFAPASGYAIACFAALWIQALWRELPRGSSQKFLMLAIVLWLIVAARALRRPVNRQALGRDSEVPGC